MLYPNYDDFLSLSTNHLEVGSHVKESPRNVYDQKKALFTVPLMKLPDRIGSPTDIPDTGLLNLPEGKLPDWNDLPVLDLMGGVISHEQAEARGLHRQRELTGCLTKASSVKRRRKHQAVDLFTCDFDDALYSNGDRQDLV